MNGESSARDCLKTRTTARAMNQKWISRFKYAPNNTHLPPADKDFSNALCGWHGTGYGGAALENGRSVFPVENRF